MSVAVGLGRLADAGGRLSRRKIARALTWHRAIGAGGPDEVEERWITASIESMVSLLDDSCLGRA